MLELQTALRDAGAELMPFGPPLDTPDGPRQLEVAEHFGQPEAEYAAIRRHVGVMHRPWRRVMPISGAEVRDFLHRLMTQDLKAMTGGQSRRSLLLDERGHIVADTVVHFGDAGSWIEVDAFDAQALRARLDAALFAEDVTLGGVESDRNGDGESRAAWQSFALLGPAAVALLDAVRVKVAADAEHPALTTPGVHQVVTLRVAGRDEPVSATVYRADSAGAPELRVWVRSTSAAALYRALLDAAGYERLDPDEEPPDEAQAAAFAQRRRESLRGRPVGWSAYNTARIEAGTPLFHIDFGPDCVPAEAGIVEDTVSFTKGCYVGQEAVARMKNRGHPKKLLVGLQLPGAAIPAAGTQVFDPDGATVIGAVTSSAASPLRGQTGVGIAMVRWGRHEPGTPVVVVADGEKVAATVRDLRHADADGAAGSA